MLVSTHRGQCVSQKLCAVHPQSDVDLGNVVFSDLKFCGEHPETY